MEPEISGSKQVGHLFAIVFSTMYKKYLTQIKGWFLYLSAGMDVCYWGDNKLIDIAFTQFLMAKTRNLTLLYIPLEYRMLDLESLGHDFVNNINVGGTNSKSFIVFHA